MTDLSWEDLRTFCDDISEHLGEWQGIPVPLDEDTPLVLNDRHPLRDAYAKLGFAGGVNIDIVVDPRYAEHGGPTGEGDLVERLGEAVRNSIEDEQIVNSWHSRSRNETVMVFHRAGKAFACTVRRAPERSMERMELWMRTIGASDAWDLDAEVAAMGTLGAMLSPRQRRHYLLTGSFLEQSPRSGLTYVFRRLRPTIAMTPRWRMLGPDSRRPPDSMRCLAVLCLHPIGYYSRSWAGCLCPSDDVIAHLTWMRGDEAGYWAAANAHDPASPEAGL